MWKDLISRDGATKMENREQGNRETAADTAQISNSFQGSSCSTGLEFHFGVVGIVGSIPLYLI